MSWQQVSLEVAPEHSDGVEAVMEALGAISITLADAADAPLLEPAPGEQPLWPRVEVTALFDAEADLADLPAALHRSIGGPDPPRVTLTLLADQPWERAWLDDFQAMRFGDDLWIVPSGCAAPDPDAINLHFDPGLAFGTGTHPTTALCLNWLAATPPVGQRVIDYGCGSGVLAVAALRLGAREVVAVDNDPQALVASEANAERNGVSDGLTLLHADEPMPAAASLVVANIVSGVLIANAGRLAGLVERPGGRLILAGVLGDQVAGVEEAFGPAFMFHREPGPEGWFRLDGRAV